MNIYEQDSFNERVAIMMESGMTEEQAKLFAFCRHACNATVQEMKVCKKVFPCPKVKDCLGK